MKQLSNSSFLMCSFINKSEMLFRSLSRYLCLYLCLYYLCTFPHSGYSAQAVSSTSLKIIHDKISLFCSKWRKKHHYIYLYICIAGHNKKLTILHWLLIRAKKLFYGNLTSIPFYYDLFWPHYPGQPKIEQLTLTVPPWTCHSLDTISCP